MLTVTGRARVIIARDTTPRDDTKGSRTSSRLERDPSHMAHLAAGAGSALAVDVDVEAGVRDQLGPAVDVVADEIVHHRAAPDEIGRSGRKVADRADVLLELRSDRALDR